MRNRVGNILRYQWFFRSISTLLCCCSIFWLAGPLVFLVAAVPGPGGDVSLRIDRFGYVFQHTTSSGDAPSFRILHQQNPNMPDWSETTADASKRLKLPGIIVANWSVSKKVVTRLLCLRHWLVVLSLAGLQLLSLNCRRVRPDG